MPLLREDRDVMIIERVTGRLKKYDVPLYKRPNGQYVLHRILKVRENDYVICGDHCIIFTINDDISPSPNRIFLAIAASASVAIYLINHYFFFLS